MPSDVLVSAILPCRGRAELTRQAVDCFLAQTWPNKELVIVDDSEMPAFPRGAPSEAGIQYWSEPGHKLVGAKRNLACSRAHGEIICHWDSDDYSAPGRIADQVARLLESGCVVTGYHTMVFLDQTARQAWRYKGDTNFALGTSLCYQRDFWKAHPFPVDAKVGEDGWFIKQARGHLVSVDAGDLMFARNHGENTSPRQMVDSYRWQKLAWPAEAA